MATDLTGTYQQAKDVFNNAGLKDDVIISIDYGNVKIFRKHLSELIKRSGSNKRFTTRIIDNDNLKIIRIV